MSLMQHHLVGHKDISLGLGCSASMVCSEVLARPPFSVGFSPPRPPCLRFLLYLEHFEPPGEKDFGNGKVQLETTECVQAVQWMQ